MGRGRGRARSLSNVLRARSVDTEKSRGEKSEEYKAKISPTVVSGIFPLVEARGFEPLSENLLPEASPSAVCDLKFPLTGSHRRDQASGSFISAGAAQSFAAPVPCICDAGDPRRRRLRADGNRS